MVKVCLLLFIVLAPSFVFAQEIFVNEIAWMGNPVESVAQNQGWRYEWVELYNNADTVGMLDGWMLELYRDKLDFRIPLQGTIEPKGYFLIGASEKISNVDLNYKNLAGKFNNSGQRVVLKNSAGEIADEVDATKGWPEGDNATKQTMERKTGIVSEWQTSKDAGGTPKAQNSAGLMAQKLMAQKLSFPEKLSFNATNSISVINGTTLSALAFALGSSAAVVLLRRRLLRA